MSDTRAPGWYPDPHDDSAELWWGGTAWTSSTRPLSPASAQDPPASLPADIAPGRSVGASRRSVSASGWSVGASGLPGFTWSRNFTWSSNSVPLAALFVGVGFVGLGLGINAALRTPANLSATATGTVAWVQFSESPRSNGMCPPVAEFVVDGKTYRAFSSERTKPCPYEVGQPIAVAYDPASPRKAEISPSGLARFIPVIFAVIGAPILFASLFYYVRSFARRLRRR